MRPEMEILRATIHLLHGQTDNSLTRIDRLFLDSDPRRGVGKELLTSLVHGVVNVVAVLNSVEHSHPKWYSLTPSCQAILIW